MKDKLKLVVAIVVVILLFALTRACSNYFMDRIREGINDETKVTISNELKSEYAKDWISSICDFLKGNIIYEDFPLSDNFRKKYKTVNDIIKGKVMGTIEANSEIFDINEDYNKHIMGIGVKTGNGFEEIIYQLHYIINENNELDDIEILDSRVYEDENGSYLHYDKFHYYYDDPVIATDILCFPYRNDFDGDPYRIFVTKEFKKKFPDCQDDKDLNDGIVGDNDYLICGEVTQDAEYPNICYAEFLDVDYTKIYKITFDILNNGYINDAKIELYKKEITKDPEYVKKRYEGYKENVRWF